MYTDFRRLKNTDFHRIDDLQLPEIHPKMAFITGALDKEIRLSFAQRIKGTLPEPYQHLITEGKEQDTPEFKYTLESKFVSHSIQRKCTNNGSYTI